MKFEDGISFDKSSCRFKLESCKNNIPSRNLPLSVIVQVTRCCNLSCVFCSEIEKMEDPTMGQLRKIRDNLLGVPRIYLSGGEPLLRKDLPQIIDLFYGNFILGLPTNAIFYTSELLKIFKEKIDFINVGLDGPRSITSRIRGDYDKIIEGIKAFSNYKIPISLSCVVLSSTLNGVPFTCQIADLLGAKKIKLILPIPKGNALDLPSSEYLSSGDAKKLFEKLKKLKDFFGWNPKITLTTWEKNVEGYSLLVYPDCNVYAWPVYEQKDKVLFLGNLLKDSIVKIWKGNPFKENHYNKYLGKNIFVA